MGEYKNSGIYMIYNTITKKRYIGSSTNLSRRKGEHVKRLNGNRHHNKHLQKSWNKYGQSVFILVNLRIEIPTNELYREEVKLILFYQSNENKYGYNMCLPDEISGNPILTEEQAKEVYSKLSIDNRAKYGARILKICILDGIVLEKFSSVIEASEKLNTAYSNIGHALRNRSVVFTKYVLVKEEDYDSTYDYRIQRSAKTLYNRRTDKKGVVKRQVLLSDTETKEALMLFQNTDEAAKALKVSKKYIYKLTSKEHKVFNKMFELDLLVIQ